MADPIKAYLPHDVTLTNYNLKYQSQTTAVLPPQNEHNIKHCSSMPPLLGNKHT